MWANRREIISVKNIVIKIQEGDLFRFYVGGDWEEITVGSKRTADISIKSQYVQPIQLKLVRRNNVWYAEDLTESGARCALYLGGKKFKKPIVKLDGAISFRREGEKANEIATLSPVKQISRKRTGSAFDLSLKTVTTVGSGEKCDIRVENPLVSEEHFFIVFDGNDCYIEDAHSVSGTYVNNRKVKRQKLSDYDRISIPTAAYIFYRNKLLYSTAAGGIRIDAVDVSKRVQDRNSRARISLVTNVTFRIEAGAFVAIVGGSGAGKSTLLDCINGMRPATDGKIYYDTNDYYENINSYKGVIGYVPQRDIMHDDLTVFDTLRYTAQLRVRADLNREELTRRVKEAIADVKLTGKEKLRISSLSGGQKKRVSIAMELLSDPKAIFLDEPTSGLSPDLDLEMMELLKELARKGRTIVVITHAMENLDKCDSVAFLGRGGRLCFYGAAKDAFRYFNRRTYSRIFAALTDEETAESYAHKFRRTDYYKKLYRELIEEYGAGCALPPEETPDEEKFAWERPPADLPRPKKRTGRAAPPPQEPLIPIEENAENEENEEREAAQEEDDNETI